MKKPLCPCGSKSVTPHNRLAYHWFCHACRGSFDPRETEGAVEGGTYCTDPTRRLELEEDGLLDAGAPIRRDRPLKGGLR